MIHTLQIVSTLKKLAVNELYAGKYKSLIIKVVYREPVTEPRSPGIVHRQSAINNKLAPNPNPNPNPSANPDPYLNL